MRITRYLTPRDGIQTGEDLGNGTARRLRPRPGGGHEPAGPVDTILRRLAPVVPTQILCIGLNYRRHAEETGARIPQHPVLFMKNLGAVQDPGGPIRLPSRPAPASSEVDYEGELAVVLARDCRDATPENALSFVAGYTCANDVSARDWQKQRGGSQWCRGKSFDTFCPLGPVLVTPDELPDPNTLTLQTRLNGRTVQSSSTADMIFSVPELIAFLSGGTTLPAGTVILTGTPEGVGMARTPPLWLQAGDRVEVEIGGIGILDNPVGTS